MCKDASRKGVFMDNGRETNSLYLSLLHRRLNKQQ